MQKLHFTKQDQEQNAKLTDAVGNYKDCVYIHSVETKNNPSDLVMEVSLKDLNGSQKYKVALADYRTQFIFQNGTYILDTKEIRAFNIQERVWHRITLAFKSINGDEPIDVSVYYELAEAKGLLFAVVG